MLPVLLAIAYTRTKIARNVYKFLMAFPSYNAY